MSAQGHEPIWDDDLQAYVDGRLSPERAEEVAAHLEAHSALAERVERYQEHRALLRQRLAAKADEPVPARLRISNIVAEHRRARRRRVMAAGMAACWLATGGALGYGASQFFGSRSVVSTEGPLVADAFAAYRTYVSEVAHPVEVDASQEAHLVQWLSNRLGAKLVAPDLDVAGYRLMGGRLLPAGDRQAAMFMYEDDSGGRLTVYVRLEASGETAFRFEEHEGTAAFFWKDRGFGYVLAGAAERARLLEAAQAVYQQFQQVPPAEDKRV